MSEFATSLRSASAALLARKLTELPYMVRDFARILRGADYFHYPDHPGGYFEDRRSYFVDFRHKAGWQGECRDGVPLLFVPSLGDSVVFPGMVLQYALGHVDKYFETGDARHQAAVTSVYRWMAGNIRPDGSFDNLVRLLHGRDRYFSDNSAMVQGEALSFLCRVIQWKLVDDTQGATALLHRIYENLVLPADQGGTVRYTGDDVFLCEYSRNDGQVVLNGWIFALFGLVDYCHLTGRTDAQALVDRTLASLERHVWSFIRGDGWTNYDNRGRMASPIYQHTHETLLDGLARLTGSALLRQACEAVTRGDTWRNRVTYTVLKARERLFDVDSYTTA